MPRKELHKKKFELVPGTLVKCKSGRYIAYYEHRTDIIANGENEADAKRNLRELYQIVTEHEENETGHPVVTLPPYSETVSFTDKIPVSNAI